MSYEIRPEPGHPGVWLVARSGEVIGKVIERRAALLGAGQVANVWIAEANGWKDGLQLLTTRASSRLVATTLLIEAHRAHVGDRENDGEVA